MARRQPVIDSFRVAQDPSGGSWRRALIEPRRSNDADRGPGEVANRNGRRLGRDAAPHRGTSWRRDLTSSSHARWDGSLRGGRPSRVDGGPPGDAAGGFGIRAWRSFVAAATVTTQCHTVPAVIVSTEPSSRPRMALVARSVKMPHSATPGRRSVWASKAAGSSRPSTARASSTALPLSVR